MIGVERQTSVIPLNAVAAADVVRRQVNEIMVLCLLQSCCLARLTYGCKI